ncbi:MAG: nucleotidyl transferase AbiEii/AbiGii toxin family protein, partial [Candidatus Micrarchaeia archaeon]
FKGGTALYMFYGLDRFSEDLDFTYFGGKALHKEIDSYMDEIIRDFGLSYKIRKDKGNVVIKENDEITGIRSELFIEGPLFSTEKKGHKIKIDISLRNDLVLKPLPQTIVSKYSDVGSITLYLLQINEMLAEKLCAIAERSKARDLYDAYFILKHKSAKFDKGLFEKKVSKRGGKISIGKVIESINRIDSRRWGEELSYLISTLPELEEVKNFVLSQIVVDHHNGF